MGYNTEQVDRIKANVQRFNKTIADDSELLTYSVESVIDRALLYLGREELEERFEKIIADVVSGVFMRYKKNENSTEPDQAISSLSDNGQSVSYATQQPPHPKRQPKHN